MLGAHQLPSDHFQIHVLDTTGTESGNRKQQLGIVEAMLEKEKQEIEKKKQWKKGTKKRNDKWEWKAEAKTFWYIGVRIRRKNEKKRVFNGAPKTNLFQRRL